MASSPHGECTSSYYFYTNLLFIGSHGMGCDLKRFRAIAFGVPMIENLPQ